VGLGNERPRGRCGSVHPGRDLPGDPVRRTRDRQGRSDATRDQEGVEFYYEILATTETGGIAHWHSQFTSPTSGSAAELDGIFLVELEADGKCTEFHEWWHRIG
jgi:hypothetical protein